MCRPCTAHKAVGLGLCRHWVLFLQHSHHLILGPVLQGQSEAAAWLAQPRAQGPPNSASLEHGSSFKPSHQVRERGPHREYGSNAKDKQMPRLSTTTLFITKVSSFPPSPLLVPLITNKLAATQHRLFLVITPSIALPSPAHCKKKPLVTVSSFNQQQWN